jgi:hypothetical protein
MKNLSEREKEIVKDIEEDLFYKQYNISRNKKINFKYVFIVLGAIFLFLLIC